MTHKICCVCKVEKPYDMFYPNRGKKNLRGGVMSLCKKCSCVKSRAWGLKNRDKVAYTKRENYLKKTYSLNQEEYTAMVDQVGGRCEICKREESNLHIDHDHTTGKIRGLLCLLCNTGLGKFRDNKEILREAIRYLDER